MSNNRGAHAGLQAPLDLPQDDDELVKRMAELEAAAEDVEHQKRLLVDLDRRANLLREGSRALKDRAAVPLPRGKIPTSKQKIWLLSAGGAFIRTTEGEALVRMEQDRQKTTVDVEDAREELKRRVVLLAHLEGPDSALSKLYQGFDLKPMNK
jgi:hypothetical protein